MRGGRCRRPGLARGIGLDNRIGPKFLHAGPGYGGSCFPKDTLALLRTAEEAGVEQRIVVDRGRGQRRRKEAMADRVKAALGGSVEGKRIGVLGLTFKPNTDDMRDAPSIPLIKGLLERGAERHGLRPGRAASRPRRCLPKIEYAASAEEAADGADAVVIVTEWDEFRASDLDRIARRMRGKALVDLRNVYNADEAQQAGLVHFGVGRGRIGSNSR